MAKYCPVKQGPALYPECLECDEKECEKARRNTNAEDKSGAGRAVREGEMLDTPHV